MNREWILVGFTGTQSLCGFLESINSAVVFRRESGVGRQGSDLILDGIERHKGLDISSAYIPMGSDDVIC